MDWKGKIFHSIFKIFLITAFVIFAVIAGVLCAFLVFQNVFDVSDTVVPSVIGDELNAVSYTHLTLPTN